ncbi:MAG: hypothetical protein ACXVBE_04105, partial [Bdellovibrionota bacterium]
MSDKLQILLKEIQGLEKSVEAEMHRLHKEVSFKVDGERVFFAKEILKLHRSLRKGLAAYLFESNFLFILSAPVIYAMLAPALLLDLFSSLYQFICFPIYGIRKVSRRDYIR